MIMSLYSDALAAGFAAIEAAAEERVSYFRGRLFELDDTPAVRGQSEYEDMTTDGGMVVRRSEDWLIRKELLVDASGNQFEPSRGDLITTSNGETYEVLAGGKGRSWRWSDPQQTSLRIHTVLRVAS